MPSPFPGMDPYLEGYLWPDVHSSIASKIRQILVPLLRPRYTARLEVYLAQDATPEGEVGILYPDVEVLQNRQNALTQLPRQEVIVTTPAALTLPLMLPVEVRIPTVEIRDTAQNRLMSCVEVLSPVNKRDPELGEYRRKRQRLYEAGVHLIELDLLRRGTRSLSHPRLPAVAYLVTLTRSSSGSVQVWSIALQDTLPTIPIPLLDPDPDVALDLGAVLQAIYDEAAYELSIDYTQAPPPPVLSTTEASWLEKRLATVRGQ